MRSKEYLQQYLKAQERQDAAMDTLEEKRRRIAGLKAITYTDMPKAPPNSNRDLSDAFAQYEQAMQTCAQIIAETEAVMTGIRRTLDRLQDRRQHMVLHMRYIQGASFRDIQLATGRSRTGIHNLHKAGLDALDVILYEQK